MARNMNPVQHIGRSPSEMETITPAVGDTWRKRSGNSVPRIVVSVMQRGLISPAGYVGYKYLGRGVEYRLTIHGWNKWAATAIRVSGEK